MYSYAKAEEKFKCAMKKIFIFKILREKEKVFKNPVSM